MKSLIPKYSYRGMDRKLPSSGDKVGVAYQSKNACYSGGDLPLGVKPKRNTEPSETPDSVSPTGQDTASEPPQAPPVKD